MLTNYRVGFFGDLGSGKTLSIILLAIKMKKMYPALQIYANMKGIKGGLVNGFLGDVISNFEKLDDTTPKLILIDELYLYLNSRSSATSFNRILSEMLFQSRKKNISIFYTSPRSMAVDPNLRDITTTFINPHYSKSKDVLTWNYLDSQSLLPTGKSIRWNKASAIFPFFSTMEYISIFDILTMQSQETRKVKERTASAAKERQEMDKVVKESMKRKR